MRVRLRFTKNGRIRFVSHRDVARLLERALRSAGIAVAYSQGFSPRPKISFGLALPVGAESDAEYLDVDLAAPVDVETFCDRINPVLPDGLAVTGAAIVATGTTSLQQAIAWCEWTIEVLHLEQAALAQSVDSLLARSVVEMERERKGKLNTVDIRPAVLSLKVVGPTPHGGELTASLATEPVAVRLNELVSLLGSDAELGRARRLSQWTMTDGRPLDPLAAAFETPALAGHTS